MTVFAAAFAIMVAGIAMFQERLLYFPVRATVAEVVSDRLAAWPDAQGFRGLVAEPTAEGPGAAADAVLRGTAIVFHGNAGHAGHRTYYVQALTGLGLRVILAEYPGYGPREGKPSEDSLVADAVATVDLARQRHGGPLLLVGESLGAAVAAAAAARRPDQVAGLLLITPWDRLANVAGYHYPWLPVSWMLRDGYDSVANLAGFGRPVVVAVAQNDTIVPERFGRALYDALAQPKQLVVLAAGGHNDWPYRLDAAWWRKTIAPLLPSPAGTATDR